MATGDVAASAGLPVVAATSDIRLGYNAINQLADAAGTHILAGGHDWTRISGKPATFPPATHTHPAGDVAAGYPYSALTGVPAIPTPPAGGRPVGDVDTSNAMGLRWNGSRVVVRINSSEFEMATLADIYALEARLTAHGI